MVESRNFSRQTLSNINHSSDYDKTVDPAYYETVMRVVGRRRLGELVTDHLHTYLPVNKNSVQLNVLDIAAGTGLISDPLFEKGYNVIAADLSQNALIYLQKKLPLIKAVKLDMNQGLPFMDESFDGVTTVAANRYILDTENFLYEVHRILKPNGVFLWPIFRSEAELWKEISGNGNQLTTDGELLTETQKVGFNHCEILKSHILTVMINKLLLPIYIPTFVVAIK